MSKRIMLGNHNSNRNKPHTQYRHEQQNTNYIDESLQSILKKNQQNSKTSNSEEGMEEESEEELPELQERFNLNYDSVDEESFDEIERNSMSNSVMISKNTNNRNEIKNNQNNNDKKQLFSGFTKHSPTKIIIQTGNEACTNTMIDNTHHSTQIMKTKSTMYTLAMTSAKPPRTFNTNILSKRQRVRVQHNFPHRTSHMNWNTRQINRHRVSGRNKYQLESLQRQTPSHPNNSQTLEESTSNQVKHRKQSDNTLSTRRDSNNLNK